uniref:Proline and serine rich 2 n=1 Tax=Mola mola TaxID=94237 RepID=A0A3Q3VYM2_MOLML
MDSLPSEYNPPLPSVSYGLTDSHFSYHPPGCIPTPVLIAQKIAENQAGGTAYVQPSSLYCRSSIESEKLSSPSTDVPSKQGPPTSAKPTRYPANISLILGSKDNQSHSLSNVNIQERRAQMLANLTGSHPLLQEESLDSWEEGSQTLPAKSTLPPKEHNSYGGKTRTINPSSGLNPSSNSPARSSKAPAPTPAPRPSQHSYHFPVATQKAAQRSVSPDKEHKRRPGSMFRPQGITVQFSGRGATDESRRDALRKLGLLKDS